ncbi:MAG: T9SS type A sorting domain-containing protein, partial [candidate division KSB1 bacterium]|nr:T9SS type A sorting domain-containing protein [candidate division KSB1 bacterium]
PFQIDEKNPFNASNNTYDTTDVLIFLAQDLGDRVSVGNWIDNPESKNYKRFEIEVADPINQNLKGWCYLFVSPTLTENDKSPVKYVSVDAANDRILGKYYQLEFAKKWYPNSIQITSEGGGTNQDIYDRTKIRFIMIVASLWVTLIEDDLTMHPDSSVTYSPNAVVRLKRKLPLEVYLFGQPSGRKVNFSMTYYPYSTLFSGQIGLDQFLGLARIKSIRMSYDLSAAASGMKFFSGDQRGLRNHDIVINGNGSLDNVDTTLVKKSRNWTMVTGAPGTMITINNVRYESLPPTTAPEPYDQYLYYWDNANGSTLPPRGVDPANDWDTGDSLSYGDHGMAFESYALTDSFNYNSTTYFLGSNQSTAVAQKMFENQSNLLLRSVRTQGYISAVSTSEEGQVPSAYCLRPNFPNPFNPSTTISFDLPAAEWVTLKIIDLQGKEILTLVDQRLNAGVHHYRWDGRDKNQQPVSSGIYIYTLKTSRFSASQKMAFIK